MDGVCNGADECRAAVRYQLKWGADVIKICSSGGVLSEADPVDVPQLTPDELNAIVSEAHAWKRKVAAHATAISRPGRPSKPAWIPSSTAASSPTKR